MRVRHVADYRTLIWAFVLFPLVPGVAYARPDWAPFLLPLGLYLAFCSGVFVHNHNHSPVFEGKAANTLYGVWLSIFYGFPAFSWIPTHNQNHHRYVNGEGDYTRTTRLSDRHTLFTALAFPLLSSYFQAAPLMRFVAQAKAGHPKLFRVIVAQSGALVVAHAVFLGLAVMWHGAFVGALTYGIAFGIPALFAPWSMMFTNYVQHVGCDPSSPHDHSRNFVSPVWNWFVFDSGFHTVHHDSPGLHWSRLREAHEKRAPLIHPSLNVDSILGFCVTSYLLNRTEAPR